MLNFDTGSLLKHASLKKILFSFLDVIQFWSRSQFVCGEYHDDVTLCGKTSSNS